ncbi:MAG: MSEP-CTERM sorting domain-containing protein [Janthinobacterium lividum]
MRNSLTPNWLLLVNTGPLVVLAALCYGEFSVIHTLLRPESVALWQQFGLALLGLGVANLAYLGWCRVKKQELSVWYGVAALVAYSLWLGFYTQHNEDILPHNGSVPRWMVPTDILVYVWTFVMPTLAHALLVLVVQTTPLDKKNSAGLNIALAVVVPMSGGVLTAMLEFVSRLPGDWRHIPWVQTVVSAVFLGGALVVGPLAFLFFLARGIYIIMQRREDKELSVVVKVLLTIVLPLLGLAVNSGLFLGGLHSQREEGIFGNFNSPWFYGLALLNGVLLCVPADGLAPRWRLALLVGRSALLGYTGYFFLVFLPWLPLSVLAIILIGTGFLMLAPLMLLVVHLTTLGDDLAALHAHYSPLVRRLALVGGALVLPLAVTASYYHSRRVLHAALEYTYTPDYAKHYDLDATALARTLAVVQGHKDNNWELFMGSQQPYLSAYFNWLVLDNLTLPESKITDLQKLFLGDKQENSNLPYRWTPPTNFAEDQGAAVGQPQLRQLSARSTFDAKEQAWVSWVDFEIANTDASRQAAEYSTALTLPAGCWVGGYYLDINGRREFGILAERKAATWVYTQIVNERTSHDPGLLSYIGPDKLSLRVYPVVGAAARRTGIQLLHKEPFILAVGGQSVQLGTPATALPVAAPLATPGGAVVYLSAAAKQQLPLVQRQPYYHFLLDVSAGQQRRKAGYVQRVQRFLREKPLPSKTQFSLVNTYTTPVPAGADWQPALQAFANAGGCYLTGAVRRTLTAAQLHPTATYPRLVVVTDSLQDAVLPADFADLQAAYPESDEFYVLRPDGQLEAHSLRQASPQPLRLAPVPDSAAALPVAVRAWPNATHALAYLPATDEAAIVLPHPAAPLAVPAGAPTRWLTGLLLHGFTQWQTLHPEAAERGHVPFIKASFQASILTPLTAYLALENEAQKAALRRKQDEVLAANSNLDAQETEPPSPKDESAAVPLNEGEWLLLFVGLAFGVRQLRRRISVA